MRITTISVFAMCMVMAIFAQADEESVQKYRNYTPEQIRDLPEKVKRSEVPIMYSFAAQSGLSVGSELSFGMYLNQLMYPGVHDYKKAVKAFQADLGDEPTGVLTVWQIHKLEQNSGMQKLSRVLFPDQFTSFKTYDYAFVKGTMIIVDDKIAWPINHVRVMCDRRNNYCRLDQTYIDIPNDESWSQNYHVMVDDSEYYDISRWSEDNIDAVPQETLSGCRTTAMNFNFKTKEFFYITRNAGGDCELLGVTLEKLQKPRISQIVDGSEIISKEFAKVEKAAYEVLASDFRKKVDRLIAEEKKK